MEQNLYTKDPLFYNESLSLEEPIDEDWPDNLFEDPDVSFDDEESDDSLYPDHLNADQLGVAMAFGEATNNNSSYDVDENTDKENLEGVMKLYPLQGMYQSTKARSLSKFEQYINDITSGQLEGPWHRD